MEHIPTYTTLVEQRMQEGRGFSKPERELVAAGAAWLRDRSLQVADELATEEVSAEVARDVAVMRESVERLFDLALRASEEAAVFEDDRMSSFLRLAYDRGRATS